MLIKHEELTRLVMSLLPQASYETCERMAAEIRSDAEAVVYSMIRYAVAKERQKEYLEHPKFG